MEQQKYCLFHNQPRIQLQSEIINLRDREICLICLKDGSAYISEISDHIKEQKNQLINKIIKISCNATEALKKFQDELQKQDQVSKTEREKIFLMVQGWIKFIQNQNSKLNELLNLRFLSTVIITEIILNEQKQLHDEIKCQLLEGLEVLKIQIKVDSLMDVLNQINNLNFKDKNKDKKFEFKQDFKYQAKDDLWQYSFAFNNSNTILFVGKGQGKISALGINNSKKLILTLVSHTARVGCLVWIQKFNLLVSGGSDAQIIIWKNYRREQQLFGHKQQITCLIKNCKEDLMISGSNDHTIKFWKCDNLIWSCKQTINIKYSFSLSLSPSEKKIISCGWCEIITLIELQTNQLWIVTQQIDCFTSGFRLCFITDRQFVFQPSDKSVLEIYQQEQEQCKFIKSSEVDVQSYKSCVFHFPCQYIQEQNFLIVKHGKYVNFFRKDELGNFKLKYSIEFQNKTLFGRLSENGQYLVTWNRGDMVITMRRLRYQE